MVKRSLWLLLLTVPVLTRADDAAINADLKKYAEATRLESIKCDNALDDAINVAGPHATNLSPDGEPFKDKPQTMVVIDALGKYPGAPPSAHKVNEIVMASA